jgi:hypothetical protein
MIYDSQSNRINIIIHVYSKENISLTCYNTYYWIIIMFFNYIPVESLKHLVKKFPSDYADLGRSNRSNGQCSVIPIAIGTYIK